MKRPLLLLPLLALAAPLNSTAESYGFFTETVEISPATETDYGFWLREEYGSILKNYSFSCSFPLELESRKFVAAKFIGLSDETRTAGLRGPYGGYGIRDLRERAIEIEMHSRVVGDVFGECTFDVKSNETARCYLVLCYTDPDNTGLILDDECDFYVFPLRTYASERPAYRILSLVPHFCQPDHLRDFYVPSQREKWDEREKDVLAALEKARAAETRPDVSEQLQLLQRKWTRVFEIRAKRKPQPEDPATNALTKLPKERKSDLADIAQALTNGQRIDYSSLTNILGSAQETKEFSVPFHLWFFDDGTCLVVSETGWGSREIQRFHWIDCDPGQFDLLMIYHPLPAELKSKLRTEMDLEALWKLLGPDDGIDITGSGTALFLWYFDDDTCLVTGKTGYEQHAFFHCEPGRYPRGGKGMEDMRIDETAEETRRSSSPATPSPAEETHAESAEPEPHAEPAEGAE